MRGGACAWTDLDLRDSLGQRTACTERAPQGDAARRPRCHIAFETPLPYQKGSEQSDELLVDLRVVVLQQVALEAEHGERAVDGHEEPEHWIGNHTLECRAPPSQEHEEGPLGIVLQHVGQRTGRILPRTCCT